MPEILKRFNEMPGAFIASTGFGASLVVKEAFVLSSSSDIPPASQATAFLLPVTVVLIVIAVIYMKKPGFTFSRHVGFSVITAVVTSVASLVLYSDLLLASSEVMIALARVIFQAGSIILLMLWIETVIPFGAKRSSLIFALACMCAGFVTILLGITAIDFEKGVLAFLPVFSITCLYFFREYNTSRRGFVLFPQSRVVSDGSFSLLSQREPRQIIVLVGVCLIPFFCYRFAFGEAAYAWIDFFGSSAVSPFSQFANALGALPPFSVPTSMLVPMPQPSVSPEACSQANCGVARSYSTVSILS